MTLHEYLGAGFVLVPIASGSKGPTTKGWNIAERCVARAEHLGRITANVGLAHAYSRTCVLDLDDLENSRLWLREKGIEVDALLSHVGAVKISSGRPNRAKLLYRLVTPIRSIKISEPVPFSDPPKRRTLFEFRCATADGLTVQDVLPPSIHPDTQLPYVWDFDELAADPLAPPELPAELLALWSSLTEQHHTREVKSPTAGLEKLRRYLKYHNPDTDHDSWLKVGFGLHSDTEGSEDGLALWNEWSSQSSKYPGPDALEQRWRSFHHDKVGGITAGWLAKGVPADPEQFDDLTHEVTAGARVVEVPADPKFRDFNVARGKFPALIGNVVEALKYPHFCGASFAYDEFRGDVVTGPAHTKDPRELRPLTDTDCVKLRIALERRRFDAVGRETIRDAVGEVADLYKCDTAKTWLNDLVWDGVPRVDEFLTTYFGAESTPYVRSVARYLWTALAGRVLEPGSKCDMVPILVGPQGIRKTSGVAALVPDPQWFVEVDLNERDEDLARAMRGCLVGEVGELRGLSSRDLEAVKTFITRTHEKWIPKYKEFAASYARRLVFIGTTNADEFLADETGNRRWLPVRVTQGDTDAIAVDRKQLWAEARELFNLTGIQYAEAERLGSGQHEQYMIHDAWADPVESWLAGTEDLGVSATEESTFPTTSRADRPFSMHALLVEALGFKAKDIKRADEMRAAKLLRKLGFCAFTAREGRTVTRKWSRKSIV